MHHIFAGQPNHVHVAIENTGKFNIATCAQYGEVLHFTQGAVRKEEEVVGT